MRRCVLPLALIATLTAALSCGPALEAPPDAMGELVEPEGPASGPAAPATPATTEVPSDPCSMRSHRSAPLELFAQPDVTEQPFVDAIGQAQRSIRVMVYELTSPSIRGALTARAAAGVDVKVILDVSKTAINQASFDALVHAGAQVHWSDPKFSYSHAKFMVLDEATAFVSTGNYDTYMHSGRNFAAIDRDERDVRGLVELFDADFGHRAPDLTCTRLVVSPVNARARHLELIRSARQTLTIESMQFSDTEVRGAVLERKQAGVSVRVLLAAPSWVSANTAAGAWLSSNGIPGRWRSSPAVHVKAFVVDGSTGFFGSENLSRTSLNNNREVGLVTDEADDLALLSTTFERDWATATPF